MQFTNRKILSVFLVLITGLVSLWSWKVFFTVVMTPGISDIWESILWFSLLTIVFFLGSVVWPHVLFRVCGAALVFLPGLFFIQGWEFIAAGVFSIIFIIKSSNNVALETKERIRFHFYKSARVGQFLFVAGLSLAIAGGYFVLLKGAVWEDLVPRFRIGEELTSIILKVAGTVNPSFAKLSDGGVTVDEFLLSLEQSRSQEGSQFQVGAENTISEQDIVSAFPAAKQYLKGQDPALLSGLNQQKVAQNLFLVSGREQVATLVGRPVAGNEKVSDVLSLALQAKLITFLSGEKAAQHIPSQAVPFFLSLLLFLTLLSITSILAPLCIFVSGLFFIIFLRIKWLKKDTFTVEQEKLAE